MSVEGSAYCPHCQRQVMTQRRGTNHVLHVLLSVFTLGIWLLVWPFVAARNRARAERCVNCGSKLTLTRRIVAPTQRAPR